MGERQLVILGIDTSGRVAGAALARGGRVLATLSREGPHSTVLLPAVRELLAAEGLGARDLELIGVARGPGSYTGLRVGVVTAKALGRAVSARVVGLSTLELFARAAPAEADRALVVLRAYKRRVLWARFDRGPGGLRQVGAPTLVAAEALPEGRGEALVTDAPELVADLAGYGVRVELEGPLAAEVALLAGAKAAAGAEDETFTLAPDYVRPPPVTLKGARR